MNSKTEWELSPNLRFLSPEEVTLHDGIGDEMLVKCDCGEHPSFCITNGSYERWYCANCHRKMISDEKGD